MKIVKRLVSIFAFSILSTIFMPLAENAASAASPASTLITCTDLNSQKTVVLKANQKLCKPLHAPAIWRIQQSDSSARSGAGYSNMRICSSKRPLINYKFIRAECNKYHVVTDYWRSTYVPLTPVITATSARGHDSAVFTLATSETATKLDSPIAYYLIQNVNTGQISKIIPNRLDQLTISNLNALTSYTFTIAAVSVDGTSPSSPITSVIKTGAVPVVTVVTTTSLAAPAFTLSASSEIRTVNTTATGFTSTFTPGTIASFAINATPPGMNFNTTTGALTGTPNTVAGATTYTVTATNTSGSAIRTFTLTVDPVVYTVGQRGPGGGIVFYVSATPFTSAGSTCNTECKYLEVAPAGWTNGGVVANDLVREWSSNTTKVTDQDTTTAGSESNFANEKFNWKIGQGFYNTSVMKVAGATSSAQTAVLAYAGGGFTGQWFIPSMNELNELCKYARGQTTGVLTVKCTSGGTFKTTASAGTDLGGFVENIYWSSSEGSAVGAWAQFFDAGGQGNINKTFTYFVRPVRAF
jgi:hypothetical protein